MERYCSVTLDYGSKSLVFKSEAGINLHKALLLNHSGISSPCGGKGTCGKCKVVVSGELSPPTEIEKSKLTRQELDAGVRLACQAVLTGDVKIRIKDEKSAFIQIDGLPYKVGISPVSQRIQIHLPGTSLTNCPDDVKRLRDGLQRDHLKISRSLMAKISNLLNEREQDILATVTEDELADINIFAEQTPDYGFAVDIGTTTIVGYLVNLITGEIEDTVSELNEQAAFGADVLSRISYGKENAEGNRVLHDKIVSQLGHMLKKTVERKGLAKDAICGISVAGNTIMMHFLMGLNPFRISVAPFTPVFTSSYFCRGEEIGLAYHPRCPVYILPSIAGYVGADIVAGMLVCSLLDPTRTQLLVDIGTNGEMALSREGAVLCCSVAAGPAFEGAGIRWGVGGIDGAIDSVDLKDGTLKIHTLSDKKPIGICGSGLLDAVSIMVQNGIIDEGGRFAEPCEWFPEAAGLWDRMQEINGEKVFVLTGPGCLPEETIFLCQQDIREVQLAKAAVHAGITTLLNNQGTTPEQVDAVWLAGGFGNKLRKESAVNIGLLPKELAPKIRFAGNTSGVGAVMALLSKDCRDKCDIIKTKARYLELSALAGFNDTFIESIGFEA